MPLGYRDPKQAPNAPKANQLALGAMATRLPTQRMTQLPTQTVTAPQPSQLATQVITAPAGGGSVGSMPTAPRVNPRGGAAATSLPATAVPRPSGVAAVTGAAGDRPAASARGAAAAPTTQAAPSAAGPQRARRGPGVVGSSSPQPAAPIRPRRGPGAVPARLAGAGLGGAALGTVTPPSGPSSQLAQGASPPGWFGSAARTVARALPVTAPLMQGADMAIAADAQPMPTSASGAGRAVRNALMQAGDAQRDDTMRAGTPAADFASGLAGFDTPAGAPPSGRSQPVQGAPSEAAGARAPSAGSQLAAGAATSVPGIQRFEGADGVPIFTNRPEETAAELAGNGGRLRYGVTSVPSVVPPPGVAMSEATGVTPAPGQRVRPAEGFTPADRLTQLAGMAMRSNNYAAGQAADRNASLVRDARSAAQAGRTVEAGQLAQLAQIAGQQSPQAGVVGLPAGVTLGAIDRDARFADRARVAAELRGQQLTNEGAALTNRGAQINNRNAELAQAQAEEQAALVADLLSGDEQRQQAAAEKLTRLNALNAKPAEPITAEVATETGTDQFVVDPRTGQVQFNPNVQRAIEQARQAVIEAEGDEKTITEIEQQLMKSYGVNLRGQPVQ